MGFRQLVAIDSGVPCRFFEGCCKLRTKFLRCLVRTTFGNESDRLLLVVFRNRVFAVTVHPLDVEPQHIHVLLLILLFLLLITV